MKYHIQLTRPAHPVRAEIDLPSSKSESNRALILRALSGGTIQIENLSAAEDTRILDQILSHLSPEINVGDAGTAMRFLTAYLAFQREDYMLTGSERMCERPIGPLVDALRKAGAKIEYMDKEGFPPLMIFGRMARFGATRVSIPGSVSSQFISALLMIAPTLPGGLTVEVKGKVASRPYIDMTLAQLEACGIEVRRAHQNFTIEKQPFRSATLRMEPDWSAASYWYSIAGLSKNSEILLRHLSGISRQGDSRIRNLIRPLGINTAHDERGAILTPVEPYGNRPQRLDFSDTPDLAQTVIVYAAAKNEQVFYKGLDSLRIKETDRIAALQKELNKFGINLTETKNGWTTFGYFKPRKAVIDPHGDHRMAMAFAPLVLLTGDLEIRDAHVVDKSYPGFWDDLKKAGFKVKKMQA